MQLEQIKPNKPSFPWVVFWFGAGIIIIFIIAITLLTIHYHKKQSPPFTKSPSVTLLVRPSEKAPARA